MSFQPLLIQDMYDVEMEPEDFLRAGKDCLCPRCGKEYWRHPDVPGHEPYLQKLCTGLIVKL